MQAGCRPVSLEGCRLAAPWLAAEKSYRCNPNFCQRDFRRRCDLPAPRGRRPVVAAVTGLTGLFQRQVLLAGGLDRLVRALHCGTSVDRGEPTLNVRIGIEGLTLVLGIAYPDVGRHVGDRILAGEVFDL